MTAQREVARCIWTTLSKDARLQRMTHLRELLSQPELPWDWPQTLVSKRSAETRAELCAGLLLHASPDVLAQIYPWLWLGQWLHVGKNASMGLGGYTVQTLATV